MLLLRRNDFERIGHMGKTLVLAEKPSVGRDLARVLNCSKKINGALEGNKYIVTWALGHLVTLAEPEKYDNKYQSWNMEDLPLLPSRLKLEIIKKTSKQFYAVKEQMERKDVEEIIIATDAGREGELVARWIIEKVYIKKPIKRLWISSVTDKAIKEGFNKLKDGKFYDNLYASAIARAEGDWIVGINATRALTCKHNAQLSCGRVQTPTLAMIAQREEEIKSFKPKTYYGISAQAHGIKFLWQDDKTNSTSTFDKNYRDNVIQSIKDKSAKVIEVKKAYKKSYPPGLYDLTELQRDANRIFGYSAKETLSIMQRLYENHKVLTYPRTDSKYISKDIVETLRDRVQACTVGAYNKLTNQILKTTIKGNPSFVDDNKVSDHHAIIPTEQRASLNALSENERKIYDLVVKRFLAVLFPPFEYEQTLIKAKAGNGVFIVKGKVVIKEGWKAVYHYQEEEDNENIEEQVLPNIERGAILKLSSILETTGQTKAPAYFNEGTLLQAMENPVRYMDSKNKDLIKTIGETGGLGTVATRADIIEKLYGGFLIEKRGKDIYITSKGKQLLDLAPKDLKSPKLTAQWEQKLNDISKGNLSK